MAQVFNTSYKVKTDNMTDNQLSNSNIENGSLVRTDSGLYMGHSGDNVRVYPQSAGSLGLGWMRIDDTEYDSSNKLNLLDQVQVVLPNNAGNVVSSDTSNYYDEATQKLTSVNENDVFITTVVFKASAANANQTHLDIMLVGAGEINMIHVVQQFYKGNNIEQGVHQVMQYYTDADFVSNGVQIKIQSHGGTSKIWDIIYFIQKTQSA